MEEKIKKLIKLALDQAGLEGRRFVVEHPARLEFGDYSTNAGIVAGKDKAQEIFKYIQTHKTEEIEKVEIKNGFINLFLSREFFRGGVEAALNEGENVGRNKRLVGKKIMVEYTDPNPFKPFHIGHLMTNAIGESIARTLEHSGAEIRRANYFGDVGLHVAKAIYGLLRNPELADQSLEHKIAAENIGKAYVSGAQAYEKDTAAKAEIDELNKKIYARSDEKINAIYDWGYKATMEAFEDIYKILDTRFDFYFPESQMAGIGAEVVRAHVGKIFEESDGAIVFRGEKHNPKLHTRVFITSHGLPTYETKEFGLTAEKFKTYPGMDLSIVITANEQAEYMRVVAKALSLIHPEYENKMRHITHGMMRLTFGKMGSRTGNVVTGESLLVDAREAIEAKMEDRGLSGLEKEKVISDLSVAAVKYAILKQAIGGDIIYDFEKSISFDGDSGPYLCYSYARANSVLAKAQKENILPDPHAAPEKIWEVEKLLYRFQEVVARAAEEYEPHYLVQYLIELARAFNSFYGNEIIVAKDEPAATYKVALTYAFALTMQTGLKLLGIQAPKKM